MLERFSYLALAWALLLVALVTNAAAAERSAAPAFPVPNLSEFCGESPVSLSCPKTGAIRCACSLSAKKAETSPVELPTLAVATALPKLRKAQRARILALPEREFSLALHTVAPPTPPPRKP